MIIEVDLHLGARVLQPDLLTAFSVSAETTDNSLVGPAMGAAGHQCEDAEHVWVSAEWVRQSVVGVVDQDWGSGFDAMLEFAASKGWLNESGSHIKAHIEVS